LRASFFRSPHFTRDFVLWFSYHSFLPGFTLSGFPNKICGFRNLNLIGKYNTKRKLWQWLEKILRARKPKRDRSRNSLYLPVIINEYENRPQILRDIISNGGKSKLRYHPQKIREVFGKNFINSRTDPFFPSPDRALKLAGATQRKFRLSL